MLITELTYLYLYRLVLIDQPFDLLHHYYIDKNKDDKNINTSLLGKPKTKFKTKKLKLIEKIDKENTATKRNQKPNRQ